MDIMGQHHLGLSVRDLDAAAAWYADVLGFRKETEWVVGDLRIALIERGGVRVELFEAPGAAPGPDEARGLSETFAQRGLKHLALSVPDVDAARDEIAAKGVGILLEPAESAAGFRYFFVRDSDGNPLEFVGPSRPG